MISTSNQIAFCTLAGTYPAVKLTSGLSAGTATLIATGPTNAGLILDILFRSKETVARNFDIFIGSSATPENNIVQVAIPANAGNNGTVALASVAALAPAIFDLDLAGNRVITLEPGVTVYVVNIVALTADVYVRVKLRSF